MEIAPGAHRIGQYQLHFFIGTDNEHGSNRGVVGGGTTLGVAARVGMNHSIQLRHLKIRIADQRIVRRRAGRVPDVLRPAPVVIHGIDAQANHFHVALVEFRFEFRDRAELGGADRREVLRMRKQYGPAVAYPIVEPNVAFRGLRLEIGRCITKLYSHEPLLSRIVGERSALRRSLRIAQILPCRHEGAARTERSYYTAWLYKYYVRPPPNSP